jgi:hypothetical protein
MWFMCGEENLTFESIQGLLRFSGFGHSVTPNLFLRFLSELFPNDLKRFLRLATSQYNLPRGGSLPRKITIQATQDISKLPVGHTCSYQVDLPDYQIYELLKYPLPLPLVFLCCSYLVFLRSHAHREKMMLALAYVDSCGFDYV